MWGDWGATNDVTIWRIRVACSVTNATCTTRMHTPMHPGTHMHARTHRPISNTYCFFLRQWFSKAPQCHVIRTLPVLFKFGIRWSWVISLVPQLMYLSVDMTLFINHWRSLKANCSFVIAKLNLMPEHLVLKAYTGFRCYAVTSTFSQPQQRLDAWLNWCRGRYVRGSEEKHLSIARNRTVGGQSVSFPIAGPPNARHLAYYIQRIPFKINTDVRQASRP
jgi:hypothetical protein